MSAFERLGLEATADEREIKRAYARELRRTRPDEDPAGFQALNEAYQQCLAYAQYQREHESPDDELDDEFESSDDDEFIEASDETTDDFDSAWSSQSDTESANASAAEPAPSAQYAPIPASELPADEPPFSFDLHAFLDELLQRSREQSPTELKRWLVALEPLYSLDLTHALRAPVAQTVSQAEPALSPPALAAVFDFFGLDVVGPNDGWLLQQAHDAQLRAENTRAFEQALAQLQSPQTRPVDRLLLRELLEPVSPGRRLLIALVAGLPTRLIHMVSTLRQIDPQLAAQRLSPDSIEYWRQVTDRSRLYCRRAVAVLSRIVLYPLLLFGTLAAVGQRTDVLGVLPNVWLVCGSTWLLLVCAQVLLPRFSQLPIFGNPNPDLPITRDGPLWLVGSFAVAALALMPFATDVATLVVFVTGSIWLIARGAALIGRTFMAMAAGVVVAACLPSYLDALLGLRDTGPPDPWVPLFLLAGVITPVLQDLSHAKRRRISLQAAREQASWFWPVMIAAVVLVIGRGTVLG